MNPGRLTCVDMCKTHSHFHESLSEMKNKLAVLDLRISDVKRPVHPQM